MDYSNEIKIIRLYGSVSGSIAHYTNIPTPYKYRSQALLIFFL